MKPALVRASFLIIGAAAVAQTAEHMESVPIAVPSDLTKLVAGEFLGRVDIHGLAIVSHRVHLIAAPETFHSVHMLGTPANLTVNDICVVKSRNPGTRDVVFSVGPDGLKLVSLIPGQTNPELLPDIHLLAGGSWANASRVVAGLASIPGGGFVQIAGLTADGRTLLTGTWANGVFAPGPSETLVRPVRDLALLRWDADEVLELAVLTGGGLVQIRRFADLLLMTHSDPGGLGYMAVLAREAVDPENPPPDELAWARPSTDNPPTWNLVLCADEDGVMSISNPQPIEIENEEQVVTTAFEMKGIAAGDFDSDGDSDVLVVPATLADWAILPQHSIHGVQSLRVREPGAPPLLAMPAVADFDHDGAEDLLISLEEVHEVHLSKKPFQMAPTDDPLDIMPEESYLAVYDTDLYTLTLGLRSLPADDVYDKIEITVWREFYGIAPQSQPLGIEPTPIYSVLVSREPGEEQSVSIRLPEHETNTPTMLLWQTKSNVWARFRLVKTDSGFVVKASQSYFLACGLPNSLPEGVLAWPGSYLPEEIELLWETVTRFGNLRDFGAKWEHSPGNGRRIWTGIAVPTQGIPPTAGGGVPSL